MRKEIQYFIYIFILGASLVVYAHTSFATKSMVKEAIQNNKEMQLLRSDIVIKRLDRIENKLDKYIHIKRR